MCGDESKVRKAAMDRLARREHARSELVAKLTAKSFDPDLIACVLNVLEQEGLLSDARFTEAFIRNRIAKGRGPVRIEHELRERGVRAELIDESLEAEQAHWCERVQLTRRKRFGDAIPKAYTERARQARFLQRRGFTGEQIRQAFAGELPRDV